MGQLTDTSSSSQPVILNYDRYDARTDHHGFFRVIVCFALGVFLAGLLSIVLLTTLAYLAPKFTGFRPSDALFIGLMNSAINPFFAVLFFGVSLWIQRWLKKEVHYGSQRAALVWGMVYELPLQTFILFVPPPSWLQYFAITWGWSILFFLVASSRLCYRCDLRDD